MSYKNISAILAIILIGGYTATVVWGIYLLRDNTETVVALISGFGALAVLAVKEFFGEPGSGNGGSDSK